MYSQKNKYTEELLLTENKRIKIVQNQAKYVNKLLDKYDEEPEKFKTEFNELMKMINREKKFKIPTVNKGGRKKTKKLKKQKTFRKYNKFKKHNSKTKKGGYGKGSCPFVTPPRAWDGTDYSYFFPKSKNGIATGGVPVFPGNIKYSKQNGGNVLNKFTPQFILNDSRLLVNSASNLVNKYKGKHIDPSPLPMYDQLKPRTLRKMGL